MNDETKIEQAFLERMCKDGVPLTVFLVNGVKLTGIATATSDECIVLNRDGHEQLVYKHSISTIGSQHTAPIGKGE